VVLGVLAWGGFASPVLAAGLTGSVTSQTFTPKVGTTRAKLEQTLLVSDGTANHAGAWTWSTTTTAVLADFLNEGDGNYLLDLTLHVRNQLNGPTPGLGFRELGVQLLDVAGLPFNGTDHLYFSAVAQLESTAFFTNPPTGGGMATDDLVWKNGLLPATNPFTEATFKMVIHLDATENFGGNGQGTFSLDMGLTVQTVPEPSTLGLALVGLASGGWWVRRKNSTRKNNP
jgi:hypothetical protein